MFRNHLENHYLTEQLVNVELTHEQWKSIVFANTEEELFNSVNESDIPTMYMYGKEILKGLWSRLRTEIVDISKEFQISIIELRNALSDNSIKEILRSFGYSITALVKSLLKSVGIVGTLCFELFEQLQQYGFADDLDRGIKHIDRFLEANPLSKKVSGFMVATVLLYIWLSMTFTGRFNSDMNLKAVILALTGKYTLSQIFATSEGKMMLTLFGTGAFVTFPWLGITAGNLMLALVYTGFMFAGENQLAQKIANKIKIGERLKIKT